MALLACLLPSGMSAAERVPEASDAVPVFVGPATLVLTGGPGTHVWDEVRFGTHAVALLLAARTAPEASRPACSTRVELPAGGVAEDAGDATAMETATTPGRATLDAAILPVLYATSELRIDSECADWSLKVAPLADPELPYTISRRSYTVRGDTLAELVPQTRRVRGTYAAYTKWDTDWQVWLARQADTCDVTHAATSLTARIILPTWRRPDDAAPAAVRRWRRFRENLETHELGHVTIALQGAHAIDAALDEGLSAPTCELAGRHATRVATTLHDRWERINARYDVRTEHGLRQGTGLR